MAYCNVLLELVDFSSGSIAATEVCREVAREERIQLQEEVVYCHIQVEIQLTGSKTCRRGGSRCGWAGVHNYDS